MTTRLACWNMVVKGDNAGSSTPEAYVEKWVITHLHDCAKARPKAPRRRPRALHTEAYNAPAVAWHSRGGCGWACAAPC